MARFTSQLSYPPVLQAKTCCSFALSPQPYLEEGRGMLSASQDAMSINWDNVYRLPSPMPEHCTTCVWYCYCYCCNCVILIHSAPVCRIIHQVVQPACMKPHPTPGRVHTHQSSSIKAPTIVKYNWLNDSSPFLEWEHNVLLCQQSEGSGFPQIYVSLLIHVFFWQWAEVIENKMPTCRF